MITVFPLPNLFDAGEEHGAVPEKAHKVQIAHGLHIIRQNHIFRPAALRRPGEDPVFPLPGHQTNPEAPVREHGHVHGIPFRRKGNGLLHIAALGNRCLRLYRFLLPAPGKANDCQSQDKRYCKYSSQHCK